MLVASRSQAKSVALRPPVGGWDAQHAIADMPERNAVILDNWFPEPDEVSIRPGHTSHATGLGGPVETIIEYTGVDGVGKVFGAANGDIFDVTSPGAVGAAVVTGMTNDRWQHVQIGTAGGQFLTAFNGDDTPRTYDGTTWSTFGATGPTVANLIWGNTHQRRLWFGEKDSLSAWYLAVNSITGAATEFPLHGLASRGGFIMAMGTWSRDSGAGADDVAVFLTSEGEAIVYAGTDPSSASTWGLVGVFRIGRPIGRRCMMKAGADLIMVTEDGFVAASSILAIDRAQSELVAISAQINDAVNDAVRDHGTLFGWQPFLYPKARMLIFNIPQTATTAHQYVFNTLTKAPCRFKGINALCWGLKENLAYVGDSAGVVHLFDGPATNDNGAAIEADGLPAFSYFGSPGIDKAFKRVEPIFKGADSPFVAVDLHIDFALNPPTASATPSATTSNAGVWGTGLWGTALWGTSNSIFKGWRGVRGVGRSAAVRVRINSTTTPTSWVSTNFIYVPGGMV